jgi:hypothetical protein
MLSQIAVCTPGRMIDLLKMKACTCMRTTYLVFDEADRMFDMGFEPQVRILIPVAERFTRNECARLCFHSQVSWQWQSALTWCARYDNAASIGAVHRRSDSTRSTDDAVLGHYAQARGAIGPRGAGRSCPDHCWPCWGRQ